LTKVWQKFLAQSLTWGQFCKTFFGVSYENVGVKTVKVFAEKSHFGQKIRQKSFKGFDPIVNAAKLFFSLSLTILTNKLDCFNPSKFNILQTS